jgi:LuxR family quorum sensing-dependent transcriptional regulator
MVKFADEARDFVDRSSQREARATVDDFRATIKRLGFAGSACGAWAGIGRQRKVRFFFLDWPQEWIDIYNSHGFVEHDFMPMEARRRISGFWWSEVVPQLKLTEVQKRLYQAGIEFGWRDVFAVPVHGPGSVQGLVTLGMRVSRAFSAGDAALVEMMARTVWECCRASEDFGTFAPDRVQLSPRERECLQWAAAGKSDTDIAALVGIKVSTAHFHIEQAKKRLGVTTRVEAVAVGVLNGVI